MNCLCTMPRYKDDKIKKLSAICETCRYKIQGPPMNVAKIFDVYIYFCSDQCYSSWLSKSGKVNLFKYH